MFWYSASKILSRFCFPNGTRVYLRWRATISNTANLSNYFGSHHVLFELIKHVEGEFKFCQSSVSRIPQFILLFGKKILTAALPRQNQFKFKPQCKISHFFVYHALDAASINVAPRLACFELTCIECVSYGATHFSICQGVVSANASLRKGVRKRDARSSV